MTRFVLDASVAVAWCFEREATPHTAQILEMLVEGEAVVPAIWPFELANALLRAERNKRVTRAETVTFLNQLQGLAILVEQDVPGRVFREILSLGREQNISVYDAAYLDLAMRQGLPLATSDQELAKAAGRLGVRRAVE